ncbi:pyruvate formate lyase family protein [Shigella flexneri]
MVKTPAKCTVASWTHGREIFTEYRKTHNQGVFDVYTKDILNCRKSGVITGLPDAYGRGRIIGDYRRVALYGIDFLTTDKQPSSSPCRLTWKTV